MATNKDDNDIVVFHSRNLLPPGGVHEDRATGPAAAALGGYLRDLGFDPSTKATTTAMDGGSNTTRNTNSKFVILQGFDMGVSSRFLVECNSNNIGERIYVTGETRQIADMEK